MGTGLFSSSFAPPSPPPPPLGPPTHQPSKSAITSLGAQREGKKKKSSQSICQVWSYWLSCADFPQISEGVNQRGNVFKSCWQKMGTTLSQNCSTRTSKVPIYVLKRGHVHVVEFHFKLQQKKTITKNKFNCFKERMQKSVPRVKSQDNCPVTIFSLDYCE